MESSHPRTPVFSTSTFSRTIDLGQPGDRFAFVVEGRVLARLCCASGAISTYWQWFERNERSSARMMPLQVAYYQDRGCRLPVALYRQRWVAWVEKVEEEEDDEADDQLQSDIDETEPREENVATAVTAIRANATMTSTTVQPGSESNSATRPPHHRTDIASDHRLPSINEMTGNLLLAPAPMHPARHAVLEYLTEQGQTLQQQGVAPTRSVSPLELPSPVIRPVPQPCSDDPPRGRKRSTTAAFLDDLLNDDDLNPVTKRRTKRSGKTLAGYSVFSRQRVTIEGRP